MADQEAIFSAANLANFSATSEFTCLIDYYARSRAYRSMYEACTSILQTAPHHPEARFYKCYAQIASNDRSGDTEAIRELEALARDTHTAPEFGLASTALLITAHKQQARPDQSSIERHKDGLKSMSKTNDSSTLLQAARFFLMTEKFKQAKQCCEKILNKSASHNKDYLAAIIYTCFMQTHPANNAVSGKESSSTSAASQRAMKKALSNIEQILQANIFDLNALHCHVMIMLRQSRMNDALNSLNLMAVHYPAYLPALIEKAQVLFLCAQFDEASRVSYSILKLQSHNIFALFNLLIYFLSKEGAQSVSIKERFHDLMTGFERQETNNYYYYYYFGAILARLSQGSRAVLLMSQNLINLAVSKFKLNPSNEASSSHFSLLLEQAYVNECMNDFAQSSSLYSAASKAETQTDQGSEITGLLGLSRMKIYQNKFKEAKQELELISELIEANQANSSHLSHSRNYLNLSYLKARIAYELDNNFIQAYELLEEFLSIFVQYQSQASSHSISAYESYMYLQNDLLFHALELLLLLVPSDPRGAGEAENSLVLQAIKILEDILHRMPGYMQAHLMRARFFYLSNRLADAEEICVQTCMVLDPNDAAVHVLLSFIYYAQESYQACSQSLEQARSLDFEVRNSIDYHLLKTRLLFLNGQIPEAKQVAAAAYDICLKQSNQFILPSALGKDKRSSNKSAAAGSSAVKVTRQDRLNVCIDLVKCLAQLGDTVEAEKILTANRKELKSPIESARLILAAVDLAMTAKDPDAAISMLRSIDAESPFYTRAKLKMADIYLHHKHNRKAYLSCHHDLLAISPTIQHQILVAEAYMSVQEPEQAIALYEAALNQGGDIELYSRIGRAMVMTHDYDRACEYYEQAIGAAAAAQHKPNANESEAQTSLVLVTSLLHELAALLVKIRRYEAASSIIEKALASINHAVETENEHEHATPIKLLSLKVDCLLLEATIAAANADTEKHHLTLNSAIDAQNDFLGTLESRGMANSSHKYNQAKDLAATLNFKMGQFYQQQQNHEQSILYYNESLRHSPAHEGALFALSKQHYSAHAFEDAKDALVSLLRVKPSHSDAQLFLADIHYQLANFEHCIYHLQSLMENPDLVHLRFEAAAKIIHILRRHGRLLDGAKVLKSCEKAVITGAKLSGDKRLADLENAAPANKNANATQDGSEDTALFPTAPGLHFCKGLYYYYLNHPRSALFHFNLARKSHDWGDRALYYMIEIYLNPDHLELFSDVTAENEADTLSTTTRMNLASAKILMNELQSHENASKQLHYQIQEDYLLMSGKNKADIEKAINHCLIVLTGDSNYVPALLCLANAYHMLGQPAKTRNYLKRISKMKHNDQFLIEFEKSYLFLAEIYLQIGKFELSTELCKKTLQLNKSNGKAWEIMGGIMEKEAAYKDASEHYEQAWYNCGQSDVNIGYKLAFNYLKCKKFVEAINVCHQTLKLNPNQPKLRKEILDKARASLRP